MKRNMLRGLAAIGFVVLLAACGSSPPTRFYTLDPVPPHASAAVPSAELRVKLAAVHIPPALDRQEMVREQAPDQLAVSDQNRWGAPLGEMIQRVLTQDLTARLGPDRVLLPEEPASDQVDQIVLDILQFDSGPTGSVTFDGSWSLVRSGSDKPLIDCHVHERESAAPGDYASDATAMSRILGRLADKIAGAVASIRPTREPGQADTLSAVSRCGL